MLFLVDQGRIKMMEKKRGQEKWTPEAAGSVVEFIFTLRVFYS